MQDDFSFSFSSMFFSRTISALSLLKWRVVVAAVVSRRRTSKKKVGGRIRKRRKKKKNE
jgi:hypothetical protein